MISFKIESHVRLGYRVLIMFTFRAMGNMSFSPQHYLDTRKPEARFSKLRRL